MYDGDNEQKLNPEWQDYGMTEGRKGVKLYALAISWQGHKKTNVDCFNVLFFKKKQGIPVHKLFPHFSKIPLKIVTLVWKLEVSPQMQVLLVSLSSVAKQQSQKWNV